MAGMSAEDAEVERNVPKIVVQPKDAAQPIASDND